MTSIRSLATAGVCTEQPVDNDHRFPRADYNELPNLLNAAT